jgi:regulator of sigma E protease
MSVLISILSFVVALGILVTVHEFGHFWVARRCGVKVLRFSVGFGKPLLSFYRKNDPTEYVIAGIPLGGYVKMLDESESTVESHEKHMAFNNKPLIQRILVVLAGPAFNFIFAILAFWLILTMGEKGLRPIIGELDKTGVAIESGLEIGDEITAVNDHPATIWRVANGLILSELLDSGFVEVTVLKPGGNIVKRHLSLADGVSIEPELLNKHVGITPQVPPLLPVLNEVLEGEPADRAGLQQGDLILSVDEKAISSWGDWVEITRSSPNTKLSIKVERKGTVFFTNVTPVEVEDGGEIVGRIGASVHIDESINEQYTTLYALGPLDGVIESLRLTTHYSVLTLKMIGRMLIGTASVENLSGPISIAKYAGQTASFGLVPFLKFLAFVSISLGVMNLLPIPMLDGGHLLFYIIEGIRGKALSEQVMQMSMRIGMSVLFAVMILAVFVDLNRFLT